MDNYKIFETDSDSLFDFIYSQVHTYIKFKPDKWIKMMSNEEYKDTIEKFLSNSESILLLFTVSTDGLLIPSLELSYPFRTKFVYFIKTTRCSISEKNKKLKVVTGECSSNVLLHLNHLINEICSPVLLNEQNQVEWSLMLNNDVKKNIYDLTENLCYILNIMKGRILLLLPRKIEHMIDDECLLKEQIEVNVKNALEKVIYDWISQISSIISEFFYIPTTNNQERTMATEIQILKRNLQNAKSILEQFESEKVKKVLQILQNSESIYVSSLHTLQNKIIKYIEENTNLTLFLKPLVVKIRTIEKLEHKDLVNEIPSLVNFLYLARKNCPEFRRQINFISIVRGICNTLVSVSVQYLNPSSFFQEDADDVLKKITNAVHALLYFKKSFQSIQENFNAENKQSLWNIDEEIIFENFSSFLDRLSILQNFFSTILQYKELEKIEFSGSAGPTLTSTIRKIYGEFLTVLNHFYNKNYNLADISDSAFLQDYIIFVDHITDMDYKLATVVRKSMENCYNLDSTIKLILILGKLLSRPVIFSEMQNKYTRLLIQFQKELEDTEIIFNELKNQLKTEEYSRIAETFPPFSRALSLIVQTKQRLIHLTDLLNYMDNTSSLTNLTNINQIQKCQQLFESVEQMEKEMAEKWLLEMPIKIENNLQKQLFVIRSNSALEMNFTEEVRDCKAKIKAKKYGIEQRPW